MAKFPFTDLHGFKDYAVFVQTYSPDQFPPREGVEPDEQWTLDLAFDGLRYGLTLAVEEKGERPVFTECRNLVDQAYGHYRAGNRRDGFQLLEKLVNLLRKVGTQ